MPSASPPFSDGTRIVGGETTADAGDVVLSVEPGSGELPTAEFRVELDNRSEEMFDTNVFGWTIWKFERDRWHRILATGAQPGTPIPGRESHEWRVDVDNTAVDELGEIPFEYGVDEITAAGFGGGEYAFSIEGSHESTAEEIGLYVRFRLTGDDPRLTPTKSVVGVERDGNVVVVASESRADTRRRFVFTLTRATRPRVQDDAQYLPVERAFQDPRFRNTHPFFGQGVERVRFEDWSGSYGPSDVWGMTRTPFVTVGEETYRLTSEELTP